MQVFLPYPNALLSLEALDDARLRKQRVEAKQLIDTILDRPTTSGKPRKGWYNHPAAVMFRQYVPYLIDYYNTSLMVYSSRGGNNIKLLPEVYPGDYVEPHWMGDNKIHASHRSRLLFKGKLDVLADRIRIHIGKRAANKWLKDNGFSELNVIREAEYQQITRLLDIAGTRQSAMSNHYLQFDWAEDDSQEYIWPSEFEECQAQ